MTSNTEDVAKGQAVPLVLGSVRGYRAWDLQAHPLGAWGQFKLSALYRKVVLHEPSSADEVYTARCVPDQSDIGRYAPHQVPGLDCRCGFYACLNCTNLTDVLDHLQWTNGRLILGVVQLSGRLILGQTGVVRAEHMRIEALVAADYWVWKGVQQEALRQRYKVPVYDGLDVREVAERYPCSTSADIEALWQAADTST